MTDRNPDVNLDTGEIPEGMYLQRGKLLMITARKARIPYGVATTRVPCSKSSRMETVGLILRLSDRPAMEIALAAKAADIIRKTPKRERQTT